MFNDLKNKRVLVTGASQGIGLAAALAFVKQGAKVGITSRSKDDNASAALKSLQQAGGDVKHYAGDLCKTEECEKLVKQFVADFGGIDVLVNNAGALGGRKSLTEIDDDFFDKVIDVNARSATMTTRFAMSHLIASAKSSGTTASVILVGSIAGYKGGGPGASLYGAAKAWLHVVQKTWVYAHTKDGVRFNVIAPGTIDTIFHLDKNSTDRANINVTIPMGRFGTSEEMAPSFLFLASHACSGYITGQIININGGQYMP